MLFWLALGSVSSVGHSAVRNLEYFCTNAAVRDASKNALLRSRHDRSGVKNAGHTLNAAGTCVLWANWPKTKTTNAAACCSTESAARICLKCIVRYLLLLAHCVEHGCSSDNVGSHTAIRRRSRERSKCAVAG